MPTTNLEEELTAQINQIYHDGYYSNNNTDKGHFKAHLQFFTDLIHSYEQKARENELHGVGNAAADAGDAAVMNYIDYRLSELKEEKR